MDRRRADLGRRHPDHRQPHRRHGRLALDLHRGLLTRPLGASIGDYLSQPKADGGLGLGTTVTSFLFLAAILALVTFLTVTKVDRTEEPADVELEAA
ncbi:hypothetical protein [Marmoricola sp. RAF53]|uniref:hypothetical protein n=1 Tax=Marmoricola sp. RAF53 TaxID=3233059 RepID=UPI003F9E2C40